MSTDAPEAPINLFDPDIAACPHAAYKTLRETAQGITRLPVVGIPLITRYDDVMYVLRHPELFSSEMEEQMALGTERPMIPQQIDPPAQTRYRKLLDPLFSLRRSNHLAPKVRKQANLLIDKFIDDGECEFDAAFAIPLPCTVFLHLFGLPLDELDLFLGIKDDIIRPHMKTEDLGEMVQVRKDAGQRLYQYFGKVIDERQTQPGGDDLMAAFLSFEIDGEKLTRNEILDICFLTLLAGLDTVTATLGCNIAYLAANPEQRQRLVENPELIPGAIEELLRTETPVTVLPRIVKEDTTVSGVRLKANEMVTLVLGASNMDESHFDDPDKVDFERERNRHLAFGGGTHRCLGSHLARMELRVAMEEWHRRIPNYEIKPGETPTYSPGIREVQYLPLVWNKS